ncbi:DTW domain-containing protein 2 [Senna tora]|uniref:tRNA-uridine aminocarboxypropyltransferase n=1 Tax=Senna tora TaxID=362788 RepID=A0A834W9Y8_9FABA|nr:DTW domain-containing protein 2 [Senna tora]
MACIGIRVQTKTRFRYAVFNPSHQRNLLLLRRSLKVSMSQGKSKRPICPSCSKPARTCLCSRILTPGIENSVSVTILQHALESKHPLNSTRIARLGLKNLQIATVSDVNFEARFVIRLMEPNCKLGLVRNGTDSSILRQASEIGETEKPIAENGDGTDSRREGARNLECSLENDIGAMKSSIILKERVDVSDKAEMHPLHSNPDCTRSGPEGNNGGSDAITAIIGKNGVISSLSHIWMPLPLPQSQKPSFSDILACPEACEALSKGFLVKKFKRSEFEGSIDLKEDEECEFELEVPPGSALLFPSDKAVDVNELDAIGFRVKNLIVLDGTWAKARRVYGENPWLNILPHLKLEVKETSLYSEVRPQPKAGYLSTIESIVHALKAVGENDHEGLDNLLDAFESMVGDQRRCNANTGLVLTQPDSVSEKSRNHMMDD